MIEQTEKLKHMLKWAFAGIFMALAFVPAVYYYDRYQKVKGELGSRKQQPEDSAKQLEELVGRHMSLPKESPSVARVSDKSALSGQEFFTRAENNDKVLIYKKAKLAVLYRPSTDKIINVGPITLEGEVAGATVSDSASKTETKTLTVAVYNSTQKAGYARTVGNSLVTKNQTLKLGPLGNTKGDFTEVLVIPFNSDAKGAAAKIAKDLGGRVTTLPSRESSPEADILVIAGK